MTTTMAGRHDGYEVDDYGKGTTGDDDYDNNDGDNGGGTERCNNQIEATAVAGGRATTTAGLRR
jgi:hypothetical protein